MIWADSLRICWRLSGACKLLCDPAFTEVGSACCITNTYRTIFAEGSYCSVCQGTFSNNQDQYRFDGSQLPLQGTLTGSQPAGTVITRVQATLHGTCYDTPVSGTANYIYGRPLPVLLGSTVVGQASATQYANLGCACDSCGDIPLAPVTIAPSVGLTLPATVTIPSIVTAAYVALHSVDFAITFCTLN